MEFPPATAKEIDTHKTRLHGVFTSKFTDPSIVLGLNTAIQSKFHPWILTDSNRYFGRNERNDVGNNQNEEAFATITYFDTLWTEFHNPIIKFFQYHHAQLYNSMQAEFEEVKKKDKAKFNVKPVEVRKLHKKLVKFVKQAQEFYSALLAHFVSRYRNPLVPKSFVEEFDLAVAENAVPIGNSSVSANFLFLIHRCLVALGDLHRHRSVIELTYVNPCLSNGNFWKYRNLTGVQKQALMRPLFKKAISYYSAAILLIPALNEPYNHIGMIYNTFDDKDEAVYWFMRSQLTRVGGYALGLSNLKATMKKDWFVDQARSHFAGEDHTTALLVYVIAHYFLPDTYSKEKSIKKGVSYTRAEAEVFVKGPKANTRYVDAQLQHLMMLFGFHRLIADPKYLEFVLQYVTHLFTHFAKLVKEKKAHTKVLMCMRLALNWIKDNKVVLRQFVSNQEVTLATAELINLLMNDSDAVDELFEANTRPTRSYYFEEDVLLKDFSAISFQLKDFKDDHLFEADNIDLLAGDYSVYIGETGIPSFLDNGVALTIEPGDKKAIAETIRVYENNLRLQAVVLLGKKLLESSNRVKFAEGKFVVEKKEKKERREKKRPVELTWARAVEEKQVDATPAPVESQVLMDVDSSDDNLDQLERFIKSHTIQLQKLADEPSDNPTDYNRRENGSSERLAPSEPLPRNAGEKTRPFAPLAAPVSAPIAMGGPMAPVAPGAPLAFPYSPAPPLAPISAPGQPGHGPLSHYGQIYGQFPALYQPAPYAPFGQFADVVSGTSLPAPGVALAPPAPPLAPYSYPSYPYQ